MSRLSLCLIARDEERMLPGCLASVREVVDEIVVVDTGSRDRTPELAAAAGAVVVDMVWQDDFSAARNRALAEASGDWVLVLDADERLAPGAADALRGVLANPDAAGAYLPLVDCTDLDASLEEAVLGATEPAMLPRLFRRSSGLRWLGRVHEQPADWLARNHGQMVACPAAIVHYGNAPEWRATRGKAERNVRLLEQQLLESPRQMDHAYLAAEYRRLGRHADARETAERGWREVGNTRRQGAEPCLTAAVTLATELAQYAIDGGEAEKALRVLAQAEELAGPHPNLYFLSGRLAELSAPATGPLRAVRLQQAARHYRSALSMRGRLFRAPLLHGVTSEWRTHRTGARSRRAR